MTPASTKKARALSETKSYLYFPEIKNVSKTTITRLSMSWSFTFQTSVQGIWSWKDRQNQNYFAQQFL